MKSIIKSLMRFKLSTTLNLIGFSVAFATSIIIMMQVKHDLTYDTHYEDSEDIYMLRKRYVNETGFSYSVNRHVPNKIRESIPSTLSTVTTYNYQYVTIKSEDDSVDDVTISQLVSRVEYDALDLFSFKFIEGNREDFDKKSSVIISRGAASRLFPNRSAIGGLIISHDAMVVGVYEDFPINATIPNAIYMNIGDENIDYPENWNYSGYIKSVAGVDKDDLIKTINDTFKDEYKDNPEYAIVFDLVEMADVREYYDGYDKNSTYILMAIAFLILLIASINFMNFSISLVPIKIKGINIRRVAGATVGELRLFVILEAIMLSLLAFGLAVGVVYMFKNSQYSRLFSASLDFEGNILIYVIALILTIFIGVISSLYPAFYSTKFQPALILKSSFGLSAKGKTFRVFLLSFQYVISFILIIATLSIQYQYDYMLNHDGGYAKEGILHVSQTYNTQNDLLKEELLKNPNITDVTFSSGSFGTRSWMMTWERPYSKGRLTFDVLPVAYNFLDFFEIKVDSGRNFRLTDEISENGVFLINKIAKATYEPIPGEKIVGHERETEIVGVCEDVNHVNIKSSINPFAFFVFGKYTWGEHSDVYIKVNGSTSGAIEHIKSCYKEVDPTVKYNIGFFSERFENSYINESNTQKRIGILSFIAIVISLIGIFGLVTFDSRYRRKEIGLRKIHGASVKSILYMFTIPYIKIVLVSFVLAVPVAYLSIQKWQEILPYKASIPIWVYAAILLGGLLLTIIVSLVQSMRVVRENPVNSIK